MNPLVHDLLLGTRPLPPRTNPACPDLGPQPLIRTGRLTLRPTAMADAPDIAGILANHKVARMLTAPPQPYHLEDAEDWLRDTVGNPDGGWIFAITRGGIRAILSPGAEAANGNASDALVGVVAIEWRETAGRKGWHLGYWLAEEQWGRGLMTEAVNAVLARFFAAHMGETLYSSVMVDNPASLRIQGKLGFDVTGVNDVYSEARAKMTRQVLTELTFGGYMPN